MSYIKAARFIYSFDSMNGYKYIFFLVFSSKTAIQQQTKSILSKDEKRVVHGVGDSWGKTFCSLILIYTVPKYRFCCQWLCRGMFVSSVLIKACRKRSEI